MKQEVLDLVFELPSIVKANTKRSYPDVENVLADLLNYIQDPKATDSSVNIKLKDIEDLLSRKNERNPKIKNHIKFIRRAQYVQPQGRNGPAVLGGDQRGVGNQPITRGPGQQSQSPRGVGNSPITRGPGQQSQSPRGVGNPPITRGPGQQSQSPRGVGNPPITRGPGQQSQSPRGVGNAPINRGPGQQSQSPRGVGNPPITRGPGQQSQSPRGVGNAPINRGPGPGLQPQSPGLEGNAPINRGPGQEPKRPCDADISIVTFVEELLEVLRYLLEYNIQDYSANTLPSLTTSLKMVRTSEEKVKAFHHKVTEMAKLCIDRNREADYTAQLLKKLGEFSQTNDKKSVEKVLRDPPKFLFHTDKEHDKQTGPTTQGKSEKYPNTMKMIETSDAVRTILHQIEEKQKLESELQTSRQKVENLLRDLDNLHGRTVQIQQLQREVETLRYRLSELAGAKLTKDNPVLADLSDPYRPTKLAEQYSELYDNQWTDAFDALKKQYPASTAKDLTGQLLNILTDGFNFCKDVRTKQVTNLEHLMLNPAQSVNSGQGSYTNQVNDIFAKHLSGAAKECCFMTGENTAKVFLNDENRRNRYGSSMKSCSKYIEDCVKLCWLMQVQTPPLCIDLATKEGHTFVKDTYREYTSPGKKISFVVWPALFLHEKGQLLTKGIAQGNG